MMITFQGTDFGISRLTPPPDRVPTPGRAHGASHWWSLLSAAAANDDHAVLGSAQEARVYLVPCRRMCLCSNFELSLIILTCELREVRDQRPWNQLTTSWPSLAILKPRGYRILIKIMISQR